MSNSAILVIRADAGGVLGTGHIMRSLALAQAYQELGGAVIFLSQSCPDSMVKRLKDEGFSHAFISAEMGSVEDAALTTKFVAKHDAKWTVVDGYQFTYPYLKSLRDMNISVLTMNDYDHCDEWCSEIVLNQNLVDETPKPTATSTFIYGIQYALLRRDFRYFQFANSRNVPQVKKLVISMGGSDPNNVTSLVLKVLNNIEVEELELKVLVGGANTHEAELKKLCEASPHNASTLKNVTDMPSLYQWADGIISAGGSTCWEWLAFGLKGCVVTIADNQVEVARSLQDRELATMMGWHTDFDLKTWKQRFHDFLTTPFQTNPGKFVDCQGAARIALMLHESELFIRRASESDCEQYYDWVNDSEVRKNSFSTEPIPWEGHQSWFLQKLQTSDTILLVAMNNNGEAVGQVRLDYDPDQSGWVIDFSISKDHRGKGYGSRAVELANQWLRHSTFKHRKLIAQVKYQNIASKKVFQKLGFTVAETEEYSIYTS